MNLQESIDGLPAKITAALKDLFPSADARVIELNAKLATAEAAVIAADGASAAFVAEVGTLKATITGQATTIEQLTAEVAALKASAKTVATASQELVAAQGIPAASLPAAPAGASASKEQQIDALRAAAAAETDPAKRAPMLRELRTLREGGDWLAPKQ